MTITPAVGNYQLLEDLATFITRRTLMTMQAARSKSSGIYCICGHCAANWKVVGSIPDGVIGNFH